MVQIVIVDGKPMNPGDLSWQPITRLGDVDIHDHTPSHSLIERCRQADIVITNKVAFSRAVLQALPKLRYIGVSATGVDNVDVRAANELGVTVSNVPYYATDSTAQHTLALLLELTNQTGVHDTKVKQGDWQRSEHFCFYNKRLTELAGKTLGLVGFGAIGRKVAALALSLGMTVKVFTRTMMNTDLAVAFVGWSELLSSSDVLSLHCPLTEDTKYLIDREALARMKENALLINTARGGLVDQSALADALNSSRIAGAALDVMTPEPPNEDNPLIGLDNCVVTPHIAWASYEARSRLLTEVADNVASFLQGEKRNVIASV